MNAIDVEQQRLQLHHQTYLRTITQSDAFVSYLLLKEKQIFILN